MRVWEYQAKTGQKGEGLSIYMNQPEYKEGLKFVASGVAGYGAAHLLTKIPSVAGKLIGTTYVSELAERVAITAPLGARAVGKELLPDVAFGLGAGFPSLNKEVKITPNKAVKEPFTNPTYPYKDIGGFEGTPYTLHGQRTLMGQVSVKRFPKNRLMKIGETLMSGKDEEGLVQELFVYKITAEGVIPKFEGNKIIGYKEIGSKQTSLVKDEIRAIYKPTGQAVTVRPTGTVDDITYFDIGGKVVSQKQLYGFGTVGERTASFNRQVTKTKPLFIAQTKLDIFNEPKRSLISKPKLDIFNEPKRSLISKPETNVVSGKQVLSTQPILKSSQELITESLKPRIEQKYSLIEKPRKLSNSDLASQSTLERNFQKLPSESKAQINYNILESEQTFTPAVFLSSKINRKIRRRLWVILSLGLKQRSRLKTDTLLKTTTLLKTDTLLKTGTLLKTDALQKTDTLLRTDTLQKTDTLLKTETLQKTDTLLKTETLQKTDTLLDTLLRTSTKNIPKRNNLTRPIPKFGIPSLQSKAEELIKLKEQKAKAYDVYIKKQQTKLGKGRYVSRGFIKANKEPLTETAAKGLGMSETDKYTNRSFYTKPGRGKPVYRPQLESFYSTLKNKYSQRKNIYTEKSKYAIDSIEEVRGIPYEAVRQRKMRFV
jgi:hypothetical protein